MASRLAQRLIKAARNGDAVAQRDLGRLYLHGGEGMAANLAAAQNWLMRAWKGGANDAALDIVAHIPPPLSDAEREQAPSTPSALSDYLAACRYAAAQGAMEAHYALGELCLAGRIADGEPALNHFHRAAAAGHIGATRRVGELMAQGIAASTESTEPTESPTNSPLHENGAAQDWLAAAAERGDAQAAERLGHLLWEQGDAAAARWLRPAAQAGDAEAMCRLAESLYIENTAAALEEAPLWLDKAARRQHPRALWRQGRARVRWLAEADGVPLAHTLPHSPSKAIAALEHAAELDETRAWWDLARIYEHAGFSGRDLRRARECLERAANADVAAAQLALGERLAARQDDLDAWLEAGRWLLAAQAQGLSQATAVLDRIADHAPRWSAEQLARQAQALTELTPEAPALALRLQLAAQFGLTMREMLFIEPQELKHGWCLTVDLRQHFRYHAWRLIHIDHEPQRETLRLAVVPSGDKRDGSDERDGSLSGATRDRARQVESRLRPLDIDPASFIHDWHSPA
ncbi:MAG TPA: hypothetical protein VJ001_11265 [Rhodocyclaceae bacterium]|nr:hypothetical protein [Rhodocyclaceae bacterium]